MSDRKRNPGPEVSTKPFLPKEFRKEREPRTREPSQIRPFFVATKVVPQANGSAYIEIENTKVICALYGPRTVTKGREDYEKGTLNVEFKFAPFSSSIYKGYAPDNNEKEYSNIIKESLLPALQLSLYPKSVIDLYFLVLQDDGSCLSACINSASAALIDAKIAMIGCVASCTATFINNQVFMDHEGVEKHDGQLVLALMPNNGNVTNVLMNGVLDSEMCALALQWCMDGAAQVSDVIQESCIEE